ncbi:hypothetical protein CsSME_00041137 [Camellia sinensis var. sinensis]
MQPPEDNRQKLWFNRRWGQQSGLPVDETHRAGGQKIREIASLCQKWGVKVLSVFAFSTENWVRPQEEVDILMNLFGEQMISIFRGGYEDWCSSFYNW